MDWAMAASNGRLIQENKEEVLADLRLKLGGLPFMIVIHPAESQIQTQQRTMLTALLGMMKRGECYPHIYSSLTTNSRIQLISGSYLHIWISSTGEIEDMTHPIWDRSRQTFDHKLRV